MSADFARDVYGVVLTSTGEVDEPATVTRRAELEASLVYEVTKPNVPRASSWLHPRDARGRGLHSGLPLGELTWDIAVGVDIGGTFTDFVFANGDGQVEVRKISTTARDPAQGVLDGLARFATERGWTLGELVSEIDLFVHGTTIATNTVIQRNGPKVGLLCTEGHRDILALRDGLKWERFNLHMDPPDPFIPRHLRRGIIERLDYSGAVVKPLDKDSVTAVLDDFRAEGVSSVAVAFLWSIVNDSHEKEAEELIRAAPARGRCRRELRRPTDDP